MIACVFVPDMVALVERTNARSTNKQIILIDAVGTSALTPLCQGRHDACLARNAASQEGYDPPVVLFTRNPWGLRTAEEDVLAIFRPDRVMRIAEADADVSRISTLRTHRVNLWQL